MSWNKLERAKDDDENSLRIYARPSGGGGLSHAKTVDGRLANPPPELAGLIPREPGDMFQIVIKPALRRGYNFVHTFSFERADIVFVPLITQEVAEQLTRRLNKLVIRLPIQPNKCLSLIESYVKEHKDSKDWKVRREPSVIIFGSEYTDDEMRNKY